MESLTTRRNNAIDAMESLWAQAFKKPTVRSFEQVSREAGKVRIQVDQFNGALKLRGYQKV